jgi:hypothetical protein
MLHRVHLGRAALIGATLCLVVPSVALADGGPEFVVGPVKVKHGYSATVNGSSCGTKYAGGTVTFTKAGKGWTESHSYGGSNSATCQIADDLSSGTLKFSFKGVTVNIKFRKKGHAKTGPLGFGCSGKTQPGIARGTVKVRIGKAFFGRVTTTRVKASVTKVNKCTPPAGYKKTANLSVFEGSETNNESLIATAPPNGPHTVNIFRSIVSKGSFQSHSLTLAGGSSLFSVKHDLSSAKVNGASKASGHLKFVATPSCKGNNRTGKVSGSLVVHFDLIGKVKLSQTKTTTSELSRNATTGPCGASYGSGGSY